MDDRVREFLETHHSTIVTSLRTDGSPHVARVSCGLVEGRLWSSGTETRLRTRHFRRDPRSSLCVLDDSDRYHWLGLDCTVDILDGADAVEQNLALYRVLAGEPDDLEEYKQAMIEEQRLIYQFNVVRAYGQY